MFAQVRCASGFSVSGSTAIGYNADQNVQWFKVTCNPDLSYVGLTQTSVATERETRRIMTCCQYAVH
jgi:hypothetical protein